MLLKLLDEELVGFTSGDVQLDELGSDGGESVIDPFEMIVRILDLSLNPFSVLGGILGDFPVSVGNSGQVGDGLGTVDLLLSPTSVVLSLFFIDGILKFEKELFDGVDGVRGHGIGAHHLIDLSVEFGGGSTTKDNCDKEKSRCSHCRFLFFCYYKLLVLLISFNISVGRIRFAKKTTEITKR